MARKELETSHEVAEADALFALISERLRVVHGDADENRLRQGYELALLAHEGQERKDGSPFILHPLEVAEICANLDMDEDSIVAAMLHDAVEDTSGRRNQAVRMNQIRQLFGPEVASMVDSLTKIKHIDFFARFTGRNKASDQARNMQRLFIAMTRDTRVIVIKLADRLHNMKTLEAMPEHKQNRISLETLEFYIPIARRLGFGEMVGELEDLVFMYLFPDEFHELQQRLGEVIPRQERIIAEMTGRLQRILDQNGIRVKQIFGRRKHLYSTFRKIQKLKRLQLDASEEIGPESVFDLMALRIIVDGTALECYRVLGLLHMHYRPIFSRFRDFIASPKENGYQTLHTTVFDEDGNVIECQIRTAQMDAEASRGIAAHWRYKESAERRDYLMKDEAWMDFIRDLSSEEVSADEFVGRTRDVFLGDQVIVLSPKNEVVNLPTGSTPIDFAYYIHTQLGHAIRGAKVNGSVVPLDYELRNGDLVEVTKASEEDAAPPPEWLVMAKSPKSLIKVRRYFRSRPREERVAVGRQLLRQQIVKEGLYPLNLTANDKLVALIKQLPVRSIDDLYDKVAQGYFQCRDIVEELKAIHRLRVEQAPAAPPAIAAAKPVSDEYSLLAPASEMGVRLAGGQPLRRKAALMLCCSPVPGDRIYGVNDREQRRVHVHRVECETLQRELPDGELLELGWEEQREELRRYPARVRVSSLNRVGLLFEILRILSARNVNLCGLNQPAAPAGGGADRSAQFELTIEVADIEELQSCLTTIASLDDVFEVARVMEPLPVESGAK